MNDSDFGVVECTQIPQSLHWADLMVLAADLSALPSPYNEHPATLVIEKLEDPEPSQPKALECSSDLTRVPHRATAPHLHHHTKGRLSPRSSTSQVSCPCTRLDQTPSLQLKKAGPAVGLLGWANL